jgi:hypothetical protein
MSDAIRLRALKAHSTDPDYLERMALHEETRDGMAERREVEKTGNVKEMNKGKR